MLTIVASPSTLSYLLLIVVSTSTIVFAVAVCGFCLQISKHRRRPIGQEENGFSTSSDDDEDDEADGGRGLRKGRPKTTAAVAVVNDTDNEIDTAFAEYERNYVYAQAEGGEAQVKSPTTDDTTFALTTTVSSSAGTAESALSARCQSSSKPLPGEQSTSALSTSSSSTDNDDHTVTVTPSEPKSTEWRHLLNDQHIDGHQFHLQQQQQQQQPQQQQQQQQHRHPAATVTDTDVGNSTRGGCHFRSSTVAQRPVSFTGTSSSRDINQSLWVADELQDVGGVHGSRHLSNSFNARIASRQASVGDTPLAGPYRFISGSATNGRRRRHHQTMNDDTRRAALEAARDAVGRRGAVPPAVGSSSCDNFRNDFSATSPFGALQTETSSKLGPRAVGRRLPPDPPTQSRELMTGSGPIRMPSGRIEAVVMETVGGGSNRLARHSSDSLTASRRAGFSGTGNGTTRQNSLRENAMGPSAPVHHNSTANSGRRVFTTAAQRAQQQGQQRPWSSLDLPSDDDVIKPAVPSSSSTTAFSRRRCLPTSPYESWNHQQPQPPAVATMAPATGSGDNDMDSSTARHFYPPPQLRTTTGIRNVVNASGQMRESKSEYFDPDTAAGMAMVPDSRGHRKTGSGTRRQASFDGNADSLRHTGMQYTNSSGCSRPTVSVQHASSFRQHRPGDINGARFQAGTTDVLQAAPDQDGGRSFGNIRMAVSQSYTTSIHQPMADGSYTTTPFTATGGAVNRTNLYPAAATTTSRHGRLDPHALHVQHSTNATGLVVEPLPDASDSSDAVFASDDDDGSNDGRRLPTTVIYGSNGDPSSKRLPGPHLKTRDSGYKSIESQMSRQSFGGPGGPVSGTAWSSTNSAVDWMHSSRAATTLGTSPTEMQTTTRTAEMTTASANFRMHLTPKTSPNNGNDDLTSKTSSINIKDCPKEGGGDATVERPQWLNDWIEWRRGNAVPSPSDVAGSENVQPTTKLSNKNIAEADADDVKPQLTDFTQSDQTAAGGGNSEQSMKLEVWKNLTRGLERTINDAGEFSISNVLAQAAQRFLSRRSSSADEAGAAAFGTKTEIQMDSSRQPTGAPSAAYGLPVRCADSFVRTSYKTASRKRREFRNRAGRLNDDEVTGSGCYRESL